MGGAVTPPKHVLPTPPVPEDLPKITFANDNARLVFYKRYVRKNVAGEPAETPEETFWRVAYHVAKAEAEFGASEEQVIERAKDFYRLLAERLFFPNSPTWTGAGTPLGQLAACFTPQMRVVTAQGLKPIVDVQVGDLVLTHQGRYRPVTETMQRSYSGPLYHIKIKGIGVVLEVTPEHPILTPSGWVEAQDLKVGDWVAVGVPQGVRAAPVFDLAQLAYAPELEVETTEDKVRARRPASYQRSGRQSRWNKRFVRLTPDLARLCGYYVAEGTIGPDERYVRFTLNKKETAYQEDIQALVRDIFGVEAQITPSNFGDWVQIDVYSRVVAAWFRTHFGRGSSGKYVPTWLLYAEDELQKAFLVGLFRGDGMYAEYTRPVSPKGKTKTWRSLRLTLANPNLVHQIWQMLLRIGYDANVRPVDTRYVTPRASETAQVDLPPLSSRDLVAEAFGKALPEPDKRYVRRHVHRQDGDIFFEVAAIQVVPFEGVVYNLEVDEDHTYVTEGVVVHNCFVLPISDDMGRKESGIFMSLRNAALIQQTGGGNGFSFSRLRPKNTIVKSSAGKATGPVGFLRVYDKAFGEIAQGGCLLPETLVFTDRGLLRLDEIVDAHQRGWQEHDLHVPTDQGLRRSPRGYNNGVASVLRVHTREGLSLAGTPNHKVKVMTPQGPQWRALEDLQPGDWILVKLGEHRGHLQALRQPTRRHGNQVWPTLPAVLDEELAFFLGYFIGDGFLASREKDHRLGVTVAEDAYLVEEMPRLMERLFGVRVHRMQKRGDRSITFYLDNRAVKEFFLLNGFIKESSRTARVPRLVRLSPPNVVAAFLRGLFEADGTLSHGYPALVTTSPDLAREVATLLIGLGAPVRVHTVAAGVDAWGHHARYVVRILSHEGLEVWRRRIGCDLRSRFVQAYAWRVDTRRESSYVLPHAEYWLAPVLEAITLPQTDRRGRGQGKKFRSVQPRLRRRLLRYVRGGRRFTLAAYRELQQAHPEAFVHAPNPAGLWFVQVAGVEPIGEHLTLDLEVADNHTYLAYGLVTHNTRRGANMAVLRVDHPDIEDFITCKTDENAITNFNISVGVTDAFMRAVENDEEWALVFPDVLAPEYETFDGTLEDAVEQGVPIKVYKKVRARDLFAKIVQQAHHNGEPGMLFLDTANRDNPVPHQYRLEATNPCFVGDTRIATARGLIPIAELAASAESFTIVTDNRAPLGGVGVAGKRLGTRLRSGVRAFKTREHVPVFRLRTRKGYTVTATADHPFLTPDRGYRELQALRPGDRILLQSGEGGWSQDYRLPNQAQVAEAVGAMALAGDRRSGHRVQRRDFAAQYANLPQEWSRELGVVLGYLVGDGWLSPESHSPVGWAIRTAAELEQIHGWLQTWFGPGHVAHRGSHYQVTYGRALYEFFASLGVLAVPSPQKRVPESIWRAPREAVVGFLQGLFGADGTVQVNPAKRDATVRLASSSRALLEDVQLLLLNFGIVSRLDARRAAGTAWLPDGHGGSRRYEVAAQYELVIGRENRDRFAHTIGFADPAKQARLMAYVESQTRGPYRETFEDEIESIEPAGYADVYDLEEPETHSLIANGLVCHNCGEQWLGPYENCCLGSINLAQHATPEGGVDWDKLQRTVERAVRFLDDVVQANAYVPAVPQLKEAAHRNRRIGLGIKGLADLMYLNRVRYGSRAAQDFAAQVMEFIRYHAMRASIDLARERGPFPGIRGSIYDPEHLTWTPPTWPDWLDGRPSMDWGRPALDWDAIVEGLRRHGIRNAAQLTIAPTGTISTVSGVEGYGCEPVFALAYYRYVNDEDGQRIRLRYVSPLFMRALDATDLDAEAKEAVIQHVLEYGTIQNYPGELPDWLRNTFVVAQDVTAEEHVRMQAALQVFVDNSISKTINFPADATVDDVANAFMLAWKLGVKGLTVYVTGSRETVVLETKATAKGKDAAKAPAAQEPAPAQAVPAAAEAGGEAVATTTAPASSGAPSPTQEEVAVTQPQLWPEFKKPRPEVLKGFTFQVNTPLGKAFVTINENGGDQPFEVFINTAKAGSETAAISEAIGRLISYILRLTSPVKPIERLEEIIRQLRGIGGDRPLGFGPYRIRSLPDGVGYALEKYLLDYRERVAGNGDRAASAEAAPSPPLPLAEDEAGANGAEAAAPMTKAFVQAGHLCPECGQATLIYEEGCAKCYSCGYSEC